MSDERDELARIIKSPENFDGGPVSCGPNDVYAARTADAILAAGYRKPRQVTTVEELDALPNGTVVMDCHGEVARKLTYGWRVLVSESGFDAWLSDPLEETYLPATVLHVGGTDD